MSISSPAPNVEYQAGSTIRALAFKKFVGRAKQLDI